MGFVTQKPTELQKFDAYIGQNESIVQSELDSTGEDQERKMRQTAEMQMCKVSNKKTYSIDVITATHVKYSNLLINVKDGLKCGPF